MESLSSSSHSTMSLGSSRDGTPRCCSATYNQGHVSAHVKCNIHQLETTVYLESSLCFESRSARTRIMKPPNTNIK